MSTVPSLSAALTGSPAAAAFVAHPNLRLLPSISLAFLIYFSARVISLDFLARRRGDGPRRPSGAAASDVATDENARHLRSDKGVEPHGASKEPHGESGRTQGHGEHFVAEMRLFDREPACFALLPSKALSDFSFLPLSLLEDHSCRLPPLSWRDRSWLHVPAGRRRADRLQHARHPVIPLAFGSSLRRHLEVLH